MRAEPIAKMVNPGLLRRAAGGVLRLVSNLNFVENGGVFETAKADNADIIRPQRLKFRLRQVIAVIADRVPDAVFPARPPETFRHAVLERLNDMHADKGLRLLAMGAAGDGRNEVIYSHIETGWLHMCAGPD